MDGISQRNLNDFTDSQPGPHDGRQHPPCTGCLTLDCHSIHGPVVQECLLSGCYICADLAKIDDEISSTYQRLSDLVKERQKIIAKPRHDAIIHHMPVEILSTIFVFVEDVIIDFKFKEHPDHVVPEPPYTQPSQSPSLLVGAVCKRWRDISLTTPWLWTDIVINLGKCAQGQFKMVKKWAHRSGALPLDITIFLNYADLQREHTVLYEYRNVLSALRSLAVRWNDIALSVPGSICHKLFDNLNEAPPINSLFLSELYGGLEPIKLQHPLRPRCLISDDFHGREIPFEWDRLEFLKMNYASIDEILYVIRNARNLKHCITEGADDFDTGDFPIPTDPITNRSLIYLETYRDIIQSLALPSLLYFDYRTSDDVDGCLDTIVEFLDRSCAPLDNPTFRCPVNLWEPFPPLERLHGVTSLFLEVDDGGDDTNLAKIDDFFLALSRRPSPDAILPHLKRITFELPDLSASSWLLLSRLFREDTQSSPADIRLVPVSSNTSIPLRNSLPRGCLSLTDNIEMAKNTDTYLRLLEVDRPEHSGWSWKGLIEYIAPLHKVILV